ncbi:MAG TPA: HNH endonuclease, partial [Thioploca sp.]|nr:HNH endonuclease [Thioploca sp.]
PSLRSRVLNVKNWRALLLWFLPITLRAVETVRFYTQKLQNAEIKGIEYQ